MSKTFVIPTSKILELTRNRINDNAIKNVEIHEYVNEYQPLGETTELGFFSCEQAKATFDKNGNIINATFPTDEEIENMGYELYTESVEPTDIGEGETITYIKMPYFVSPNIVMDISSISYTYSIDNYSVEDEQWTSNTINGEVIIGTENDLFSELKVYFDTSYTESITVAYGTFIIPIKTVIVFPGEPDITSYLNVKISINARETISEEKTRDYNSNNNTEYTISSNTFNNSKTKRENSNINDWNALNIINYYKNGVDTLSMRIVCMDYYDSDGNKIIDNSQGQLPKCGDYFTIVSKNNNQNDNKKYIITSSEFIFNGVPQVKIEAKEVA